MTDEEKVEAPAAEAAKEEPTAEPEAEAQLEAESKPHPLEKGGERFEQVYGRLKDTERQLEAERAARVAAEAAKPKETPKERVYTDEELDALEEDALARGDRTTVRSVREYRTQRAAEAVYAKHQAAAVRAQLHQAVTGSLLQTFPDLAQQDSELFKAAAGEFGMLSQEYQLKGFDIAADPHATELAVGRALRKNPKLANKLLGDSMAKPKATSEKETYVGEGTAKPAAAEGARAPKLTQRELDFCRRTGTDPKEYAKWRPQYQTYRRPGE